MKFILLLFTSIFGLLASVASSIDLKCDLDNTIHTDNGICTITNVISNHEKDEFNSYLNGIFEEVIFRNSSLIKVPKELVQQNNIISLRMEKCGIKLIESDTFIAANALVKLYLAGNRLEIVTKGMFHGLESLRLLDLSQNKINQIESNAFFDMEQLEYLNLETNKLTTLSLTFNTLTGLKIDVRDNLELNAVDYTCADHMSLCSVLVLDDNTVDLTCDVDNQIMEGVCLFKKVQITDETTPRVMRKWAEFGLGYYRHSLLNTNYFKEIIFIDSEMEKIPTILFDCYESLQYLNVSGTKLSVLEPFSFKNASNLIDIDLSLNLLKEIGPDVFVGAKELAVIDLSDNQLTKIDKHAFSMLTKLTSLTLSGNFLKTIDFELRFNFPLVLNISNCSTQVLRITSYTETYIMPFSGSVIDACHNDLEEIDLIPHGPIVTLMLENNSKAFNLSDITKMSSIVTLSLKNNQDIEIKNGAFKEMLQLESLDLSNTNLKLKYGLFNRNSKIRKLDLSNNALNEIDFYKLAPLKQLEDLNLNDNALHKLNTFSLQMALPHLKRISFLDNNFYCDLLSQAIVALNEKRIEIQYGSDEALNEYQDNIDGIRCVEYDDETSSHKRNLMMEKQLDRLDRTYLTFYAIKKAYL